MTMENEIREMAAALGIAHTLMNRLRDEFAGKVLTAALEDGAHLPLGFDDYMREHAQINVDELGRVTVSGLGGPDDILFGYLLAMNVDGRDDEDVLSEATYITSLYLHHLGLQSLNPGDAAIEYMLLHVPDDLEHAVCEAIVHSIDFDPAELEGEIDDAVLAALGICPSQNLIDVFTEHGIHVGAGVV